MKNLTNISKQKGFTIIETMIAVSLFLVVIMIGMDSLLNANVIHQKSQDMRSVLDNLNFIMEDMSRNLRTASSIHCIDDNIFTPGYIATPRSCATGGAVAFEHSRFGIPGDDSDQWIYKIESVSGGPYNISKSVDSGITWVQMNTPDIVISSISGFSVLGAESLSSADKQQPFVIIRLTGKVLLKSGEASPFSIQTAVSQRLLDV